MPQVDSGGPRLALESIQSEVLFGYNRSPDIDRAPTDAAYLLLRFGRSAERPSAADVTRARDLMRSIPVRWASEFRADEVRINVGLTHSGLSTLLGGGELETSLAGAPAIEELAATLAARSAALGDVGASAAATWCFSDGAAAADGLSNVDAVVMVFGPSAQDVVERIEDLARRAHLAGATCRVERACALEGDREHFGYVDGISQPAIEGLVGPVDGYGTVTDDGSWRPVRAGELVLGYEDEERPFGGPSFLEHGTFFVLRKLEQDVSAFHDFLCTEAARLGVTPDELAAWLMGRDFDGNPLLPGGASRNAFRYAADGDGFGCPFGAHIRRANPRDTSGRVGDRSERHRMVRRGLTYAERADGSWVPTTRSRGDRIRTGDVVSETAVCDSRCGLMFGCFVASLSRQFEIVQGGWLNGGETSPRKLFTHDPVAGTHLATDHFIVPGRPPMVVQGVRQFTTTRGGAYFFIPGRGAWHRLTGAPAPKRVVPPISWQPSLRTAAPGVGRPGGPYRDGATPPSRSAIQRVRHMAGSWFRGGIAGRGWLEREVIPEQQLLLILAPVQTGRRAEVERVLADAAALDAVFSGIRGGAKAGGPCCIHHARLLLTPCLHEFEEGKDPLWDSPAQVRLPNGEEPYLFFGCWFDGPIEDVVEALLAAEHRLPFTLCAGYPRSADAAALSRFVNDHRIPVLFAYNAYSAPTAVIQRALDVRQRFVSLVARLSGAEDATSLIDAFFDRLSSEAFRASEADPSDRGRRR